MNPPIIPLVDGTAAGIETSRLSYISEAITSDKFSAGELRDIYLFGLDLSDNAGNPFPESMFRHYLNAAIAHIERILGIQIEESEELEKHDFYQNDYGNWGYLQLFKCPAIEVLELKLTYGNQNGMHIPREWIQLNKTTGQITLFPVSGVTSSLIIGADGSIIGLQNRLSYAPMLWQVKYRAGMDAIPADLYEAIYKKAAISVLQIWGDLMLGAGIANQAISLDGLSQSIGTTKSSGYGGAAARVNEYKQDLDQRLLPALKSYFTGIKMVVL